MNMKVLLELLATRLSEILKICSAKWRIVWNNRTGVKIKLIQYTSFTMMKSQVSAESWYYLENRSQISYMKLKRDALLFVKW